MNTELKNCPFCGGEAGLKLGFCQLDNYVACLKCGSRTVFYNTEESAIKTWNTRKPIDKIVEQLEEKADEANDKWSFPSKGERDYAYYDGKEDGLREAIEVVKKGGINE